jgi:hypothetical protein
MQEEASVTLPSAQRSTSKRTVLMAAVIGAGMLLFLGIQSMRGAQATDQGTPVFVQQRVASASFSASAPDAAPGSNAGATAPIRYGSLTFHGYACTLDCSGHEAGYNWGKTAGIRHPASGGLPNRPRILALVHRRLLGRSRSPRIVSVGTNSVSCRATG